MGKDVNVEKETRASVQDAPADVTLAGAVLSRYQAQRDKSGNKLKTLVLAAQKQAANPTYPLTPKEIARRLNTSEKSAIRALHDLRNGHLLVVAEQGGQGRASLYRLATAQDLAQLPARGRKGTRAATRKSSSLESAPRKRHAKKVIDAAPSQVDVIWTTWREANLGAGRHVPLLTNADAGAVAAIGEWLQGEQLTLEELSHLFQAFLADEDGELVREGHAIRFLPERVNRYLNRTRAEPPPAEATVVAEVAAAVTPGA